MDWMIRHAHCSLCHNRMTAHIVLLISLLTLQQCDCEEAPDCRQHADVLSSRMKESGPKVNPIESNRIEIIWEHLVVGISLYCLRKIELRNGYGEALASEKQYEKIVQKKPFIQTFSICKRETEKNKKFHIIFYFKNAEILYAQSKFAEYKLPDYFSRLNTPPYWINDLNITLALMHNMASPSIYNTCFERVEICECYPSKSNYF